MTSEQSDSRKSPWASCVTSERQATFTDVTRSNERRSELYCAARPKSRSSRVRRNPGRGQWMPGQQITPSKNDRRSHTGPSKPTTSSFYHENSEKGKTTLPKAQAAIIQSEAIPTMLSEPQKAHVGSDVDAIKHAQKTTVVNVRKAELRKLGYTDLENWLKNPDHVYIGRNMTHYVPGALGSKWGNPFKHTKDGSVGREECCHMYKEYVVKDQRLHDGNKTLLQSLGELKGKTLGCWCHPQMCHGHILVQLIEEHCK